MHALKFPALGRCLAAIHVTSIFLAAGMQAGAAPLRLAGSDFLTPVIDGLIESGSIARADLAVELKGTVPGVAALAAGAADAALLVRVPETDSLDASRFTRVPVAYLAAVVLVSLSNPIEQIDLVQLKQIFAVPATGAVPRWVDVGFDNEIGLRTVAPIVPARARSPLADFVAGHVFGADSLGRNVQVVENIPQILKNTAVERAAIALYPLVVLQDDLRIVPVAPTAEEMPVLPTRANLEAGRYPVAVSIDLVFRTEASAAVRSLLGSLASDEAAGAFEKAWFVPLSADSRAQLRARTARP